MSVETDTSASQSARSAGAQVVHERLRQGIVSAPLSLPLTPFDQSDAIDAAAFRLHMQAQLASRPGAILVCSRAGEFASLALAEYAELVRVAVEVAGGIVPIIAGISDRPAIALEFARAAECAGADAGLLLVSPLTSAPPEGVLALVHKMSTATDLPLLLSQDPQVTLSNRTVKGLGQVRELIGVVECTGDLVQAQRLRLVAPAHWLFINGGQSAEILARPYRSVGINTYASVVHAFAPEIAASFFMGLSEGDDRWVEELLREFFLPLAELTERESGYAVSLPKAAARLRGAQMGRVRSPLMEPAPGDIRDLDALLTHGLRLVAPDW